MENFRGKKRPTISLKLFSTFSDSFSNPTPTKSPRNFQDGVVGLGIVAAMTDSAHSHQPICFAPSPRSTSPIPIASSDKAKPNFGGVFDSENSDELSEIPSCVVSNFGDDLIKKQFYFCDSPAKANMGRFKREFWGDDFLTNCHLCKKELHGLDIFMYRLELIYNQLMQKMISRLLG